MKQNVLIKKDNFVILLHFFKITFLCLMLPNITIAKQSYIVTKNLSNGTAAAEAEELWSY